MDKTKHVSASAGPELSAILVTPDRYETIRRTVSWLRAQTARDRLEVVIVGPSHEALEVDESELHDFHGFRVVPLGEFRSMAQGMAAGVRAAAAPVIVFTEDHCYPRPEWAQALIDAHRGPWAAVGPVVINANPDSAISRADFIGYLTWTEPASPRTHDHLPWNNSAYKRDVLLEFGPELEPMLRAESVLHWELRSRGHELFHEPAARTIHFNFSRASYWIPANFLHGRNFGAERAHGGGWGPARRLVYTLAWPLIPAVRLRRAVRAMRRAGAGETLARVLPAMALGLIASGLGEAFGYALGIGPADERYAKYQFHRDRGVNRRDRAAMERAVPESEPAPAPEPAPGP